MSHRHLVDLSSGLRDKAKSLYLAGQGQGFSIPLVSSLLYTEMVEETLHVSMTKNSMTINYKETQAPAVLDLVLFYCFGQCDECLMSLCVC